MKLPWSKIVNALGYQVVWFATLFGASQGHFWLGFFSSALFAAVMLGFGGKAKADIRIAIIGLILGVAIDTMFAASGWIEYAMPWAIVGIAPLWIIALWLSFSFTLNHSLEFLRHNTLVATLFGLLGGPLAYWCADRLFNVIEYRAEISLVMIGLGLCWACVIPAIFYIDKQVAVMGTPSKASA